MEPESVSVYRHRLRLGHTLRQLWNRREIVFILAERDIRATYKQATLGAAWAILAPVATLVIMDLVFKRVKAFQVGHVPYLLFVYVGLLAWQFFASSVGSGSSSILSNKALLAKVHFPRECFPLSQVLEAAVNTTLAASVLIILFVTTGYGPHVQSLWIPLFIVIEALFTVGVVLATSVLLVHVRDLVQVLPIVLQLGLFASPVIWPFSKIPSGLRPLYSFFNPLGPVVDNVRRTLLFGQEPTWGLLAVAAIGSICYLVGGYTIFKRLEASLADIA